MSAIEADPRCPTVSMKGTLPPHDGFCNVLVSFLLTVLVDLDAEVERFPDPGSGDVSPVGVRDPQPDVGGGCGGIDHRRRCRLDPAWIRTAFTQVKSISLK